MNLPGVVTIREAGFFLSLALAAAHMWRMRRPEWPPMRLLLLIWPALALITIIPGEDISRSLSEVKKEIVYPVLAFWVFYVMTRSGRDFAYLGAWFLSGAALMAAAGMYFYYVLGFGFEVLEESGFAYGKRPYFGFFMASASVVGLGLGLTKGVGWRLRAFALALAPLCVLGVYFARLRAGYLAIIAAIAVFIIYGKVLRSGLRARLAATAIAALILVSIVPMVSARRDLNVDLSLVGWKSAIEKLKAEERWIIWEGSAREIMKRPLQGLGFGNKEIFVPAFRLGHVYPHNLFLSYGVMAGAGGMIFLILLFWKLFRLMHSAALSGAGKEWFFIGVSGVGLLLAFLVLNMTEDIMTRHTGQTFWALSGMVLGSSRRHG